LMKRCTSASWPLTHKNLLMPGSTCLPAQRRMRGWRVNPGSGHSAPPPAPRWCELQLG
jgi:hypothetical protein